MAISLASKTNVDTTDPDYPFGKILDDTGSGDGTPVNAEVYGDFHQFFAALLSNGGVTANDLPENDPNGYQYIEALGNLINTLISGNAAVQAVTTGWTTVATAPVTASSGTVTVGTIDYHRFKRMGLTLFWQVQLSSMELSTTPATLELPLPVAVSTGYKIVNVGFYINGIYIDGTTNQNILIELDESKVILKRNANASTNFDAGPNQGLMLNIVAELTTV